MSINWVMLTADGKDIVPLQNETVFFREHGVRFELDSSNGGYPGAGSSYSAKSGTLLLTNQRIVFISATPTPYFTTASLPIDKVQDSKLVQPWFSAATFKAVVTPVPGGGMSQPARLAISFTSGSIHEFESQYRSLRERLQELDGATPHHLEQLPMYNPPSGPVPTSTYTSSFTPADQGTSGTGLAPTSTTSAPWPQPIPHVQPYVLAPAPTPNTIAAPNTPSAPGYNAPPQPQPLPVPTPSDLPPSYDEIR
ncbi:hypothetical protein BGZ97_010784 [Linnemannia gamsii]|uniref:GRAM domain-containing protein n=1 Tax=Linnemannia gamsii TaxID=64522 RepID=A0A9P6R9C8_9FUNG|nr:hypothetical protein BGZ97_010784 [Linnemannia gamsii]